MSEDHPLDLAVTWLFVPGHRPDRVEKALDSPADVVIVDLEDAVPEHAKEQARNVVRRMAAQSRSERLRRVVVRVNSQGSVWYDEDVAMVANSSLAVMVPKAEPGGQWHDLAGSGIHRVVALIETARGVMGAAEVAKSVHRLALGNADLGAELHVDPGNHHALAATRGQLTLASAAYGLPGPVDGITTAVSDADLVRSDAAHAAAMGFAGKLCIHPRQLAPVAESFLPTASELTWARKIVGAMVGEDTGATSVDGAMVDAPVLARARWILGRSRQHD
jgi:citrate lyase subunit beta/citryl-CoA lyase